MQDGTTALFLSAQEGHLEVAEFLLRQGADVDSVRTVNIAFASSAYWSVRKLEMHLTVLTLFTFERN